MKSLPLICMTTVCLMALPACSPDPEKLRSLTEQVDTARAERHDFAQQLSRLRRQVEEASADRENLTTARLAAEALLTSTREEIDALSAEMAAYKKDYRRAIQARAKGMSLPDFTSGTTHFEHVVVSSASDTELTVITSSGVARIALSEAPPAIQELFAYDPALRSAGSTGPAAPPVNYVERALQDAQRAVEENKRILLERKAASQKKKKRPPAYLQAPPTGNKPWSWRSYSSFEGSYYAPLKKH